MISNETRAQIRRYFYAEHWKIGTIASELSVHPDAVRNAIESERFKSTQPLRASVADPYIGFIRLILEQHPDCAPHASTRWFVIAGTAEASCNCAGSLPAYALKGAKPSCNFKCFPESRPKSIGRISAT
jgi:hypothetical protein